jgi:hypothetical protein
MRRRQDELRRDDMPKGTTTITVTIAMRPTASGRVKVNVGMHGIQWADGLSRDQREAITDAIGAAVGGVLRRGHHGGPDAPLLSVTRDLV